MWRNCLMPEEVACAIIAVIVIAAYAIIDIWRAGR